jgi:hypothetical protein
MKTSRALLSGLVLFTMASLAARADSYSYQGATGGDWSVPANWYDTTNPPGTASPGTSDTANIYNSGSGNQTVIYDSAASDTLNTLNLTESGTGTDEVDYQRSQGGVNGYITNSFTLSSTTGTSEFVLDQTSNTITNGTQLYIGTGSGGANPGTITVGVGGDLDVRPFANTSNNAAVINANVSVTGGLVNFEETQENSLLTQESSANSTINGSFTMTGGTFNVSATPLLDTPTSGSINVVGNNRINIYGNLNITGGVVTENTGAGGFFLYGATNVLTGLSTPYSNVSGESITLEAATTSFSTDQVITQGFNSRYGSSGQVVTLSDTNTAATGNIGQYVLNAATTNGGTSTNTLKLGSNLTVIANASDNITAGTTGDTGTFSATYDIDLQSHTLNTSLTGTVFKANTPTASGLLDTANWNIISTGGSGTFAATGFTLNAANSTSIGTGVTLLSNGGSSSAGVVNNLSSGTSSTSPGTISSGSTFLYTGASSGTATPSTLISNRAIGNLQVQNGILQINNAAIGTLNVAGLTNSVTAGGTLDLSVLTGSATPVVTLTGTAATMAITGANLTLNLGANTSNATFSQMAATGTGTTLTLDLNMITVKQGTGFSLTSTYQIFTGFSAVTTDPLIATNITGYDAIIDSTGLLSFTAVPEPATWALLLGGIGLMGFWQGRRRLS